MVHPRRLVDPASHRHRRLLFVEFGLTLITGEALGEQSAATLEHPTGSIRANPNNASCSSPRRSRPASSNPFEAFGNGVDMTGRHVTGSQRSLEAGIASHTSNDPTPLSSPASNDADIRSTPQRLIRSDPPPPTPASGGRSPHRPHQPNPAPAAPTSPRRPNQPRSHPSASTANNWRLPRRHHDRPSPNPSRSR